MLGEQVADRVVDQVDETLLAPHACLGHVADDHPHVLTVGFLAHAVDHVPGLLDALGVDAGALEWQGDAAGADRELRRITPAGEPREKRDGLLLVSASLRAS